MALFYKPPDGWAGDVIPYFWRGEYHLFYLKDYRDRAQWGEGTPWWHLGTRDFVSFTDYGEALPRGSTQEQDLYVFTGSVTASPDHRFHIFYTGHNPYFRQAGRPEQGIMHAVSDDLIHWIKIPEETFYAPLDRYEPHDWRDPFVFWNEEAGEWWMLLAARLKEGPSRRRGCTALCTSKDLHSWVVQEPLYAPGMYYTHECPDLFRIGEWWYLLFSEFSQACLTRYRMSRSPRGPWLAPADDAFDGRAFYAAKTASDGRERYLFGWNPTREGEKDNGDWQWGGNIVPHQVYQQPDGTLAVRPAASIAGTLHKGIPLAFEPVLGRVGQTSENALAVDGTLTYACASLGNLPETCKIEVTLRYGEGTRAFGLVLRMDGEFERGYAVHFEPARQRLVFDAWPRAGDLDHLPGLERPLELTLGEPVKLTLLVDGSLLEVYANERVALSARMYDPREGRWGVCAEGGEVRVESAALCV